VFRESLATALSAHADFDVQHCASIADALRVLPRFEADVVLLDHDLGPERGWQFFDAAAHKDIRCRVLVLTAWVSEGEVRRLLKYGAAGILRKENSLNSLVTAIRVVGRGESWLDDCFLAQPVQKPGMATEILSAGERLSDKDRKVLRYVLEGLTNKDIAWRLSYSESYVKAILQRLFRQTGVRSRGQLVRVALERFGGQI
jgi:DNA-binding NarL/FixJ family response regulator